MQDEPAPTPPPSAARKPVDLGNGRLAASFAYGDAALLSLARVHPDLGLVELTGAPAFDEALRGDPAATRRHRASLTADAAACCWLESAEGERCRIATVDLADRARPGWSGQLAGSPVRAWAGTTEDGAIELRWEVTGWQHPEPPRLRVQGRLELPALPEITETDPPARRPSANRFATDGDALHIRDAGLGAQATLRVDGASWTLDPSGPSARPTPPADRTGSWTMRLRADIAIEGTHRGMLGPPATGTAPEPDLLVSRALAYVRGCTAQSVDAGERVILTDHRLLPLSWTRDAYYQALLLLATGAEGDAAIVADHLRWLWRRCDRPDGRWLRSHYASGAQKDRAFQADQQLYPMLELADYWRATGRLPEGIDWRATLPTAWAATQSEIDEDLGLIRSTENAADDPAAAPFIAASQILLWYTASRLAEVARGTDSIGLEAAVLGDAATSAWDAFHRHFAVAGPWPYAIDGSGGAHRYHDANDLPLALAPAWGFCAADDHRWRATIEFAWSDANPGMAPGPRGGLGSLHTPGAWTLGDVQDWLIGTAMGDEARAAHALARLREVAFADGMLPEVYSVTSEPDLRVRHWFAWPGAAIGAFLILDRRGLLVERLSAG